MYYMDKVMNCRIFMKIDPTSYRLDPVATAPGSDSNALRRVTQVNPLNRSGAAGFFVDIDHGAADADFIL